MFAAPEKILSFLTDRQHLEPHSDLGRVLARLCSELGACPTVADRAAQRLDLPRGRAIGRLRRTELTQLARAIHRFASAGRLEAEPIR